MAALKRLGAIYLIGVAVAVAAYFIINPLHAESYNPENIWFTLDILMVIAMPLALDFNFRRKRRADAEREPGDAVTRKYLEANIAFYATAGITILLLHNWFSLLAFGADTALGTGEGQTLNHQAWVIWAVVDTLLPLIIGATGCAMWRDAAGE